MHTAQCLPLSASVEQVILPERHCQKDVTPGAGLVETVFPFFVPKGAAFYVNSYGVSVRLSLYAAADTDGSPAWLFPVSSIPGRVRVIAPETITRLGVFITSIGTNKVWAWTERDIPADILPRESA